MQDTRKWSLSNSEKDTYIEQLTYNLAILRTQAGISQEELSNIIGISRQTYSAIERLNRKMAWSTFLALVLFYDTNTKTHKLLRKLSLFPQELFARFNGPQQEDDTRNCSLLGEEGREIVESLDEEALQTIRSTIMLEYARCTKLPSDRVIKSFNGIVFFNGAKKKEERDLRDMEIDKAVKSLKNANEKK